MGFISVLKSLKELFPQIDSRTLSAVAIEHRKNVDAAVLAVLSDIIPFLDEKSRQSSPVSGSTGVGQSSNDDAAGPGKNEAASLMNKNLAAEFFQSLHDVSVGCLEFSYDTDGGKEKEDGQILEPILSAKREENFEEPTADRFSHVQSELVINENAENGPSEAIRTSDREDLIDDNSELPHQNNIEVSQAGHTCAMDNLENIIAEARNKKEALFFARESVIRKMKEVEDKEKAAEKAKEEAANGSADLLIRVEEIKDILEYAKEANDMYTGEVYAEKAILDTELRELKLRLLCLLNERDKHLTILDEMHQSLNMRLAAVEDVIRSAEQEKAEKEVHAQQALVEQELIMNEVAQKSHMLKQQAEENAKLREFLDDRGRLVDTLQAEIAVICQDVSMLRRFGDNVP